MSCFLCPQLFIDPGTEVLASQLLLCLFAGSSIS